MTSPPPPDPPLLTPNPEQIADPWREVVDPKPMNRNQRL